MGVDGMKFNRNRLRLAGQIEQPSDELVKNTLGLWNCSVEDALRYGGDLTRSAIGAMNIRNDRKYVLVDTKIHMLMKGFCPAIPGWHTDGVPRGEERNPAGKGLPNIHAQEDESIRPPRFHLLVTGEGCLTHFLAGTNIEVPVPAEPSKELYKNMSTYVNNLVKQGHDVIQATSCQVTEFDWWDIHQGIVASKSEWRFLIRVCETDHIPPKSDLREIIRTQQNVYVPSEFGW
jgi:hypothetical protein